MAMLVASLDAKDLCPHGAQRLLFWSVFHERKSPPALIKLAKIITFAPEPESLEFAHTVRSQL
jgi:hypothetical protein